MQSKTDFVKITSADAMRVASRNDENKNKQDEQKKKKKDHENKDSEYKEYIEKLNEEDLIDYGNNIILKNKEDEKEFIEIKNKKNITNLKQDKTNEHINNDNIEAIEENIDNENHNIKDEIETSIYHLENLLKHYKVFLKCVHEETKILNIDDIDFLDDIIRQKDIILNKIEESRKLLDFNLFKKLPEKNKNKIKANSILSDINGVVNEIIHYEDENRVELQSVKEKMKLEIIKKDKSAKTISQFEQTVVKSHFIDTKK
jgi:hypothetical protein